MKMKLRLLNVLPLALLLLHLGTAHADIIVFNDRASFSGAVKAASQLIDTFDDLPPGLLIVATPLSRGIGRIATGPGNFAGVDGGGGDMWLATDRPGDAMIFYNLNGGASSSYAGVGAEFFLTDDSGAVVAGSVDLRILTIGSGNHTLRLDNRTSDSFFGFLGSQVMRIAVTPVDVHHHVTVNDFTVAYAVPEPGTHVTLLTGLCLIGSMAARRQFRRASAHGATAGRSI